MAVLRDKPGLGHRNAVSLIKKAAAAVLDAQGIETPCVISVLLTDDAGIRELNRVYRSRDETTDVLSFPQNNICPGKFFSETLERDPGTGAVLLGDMAISLTRCEAQGTEYGHGAERELIYLTVHSVLHLLGYDHIDEGEQKALMRQREKAILKNMGEYR